MDLLIQAAMPLHQQDHMGLLHQVAMHLLLQDHMGLLHTCHKQAHITLLLHMHHPLHIPQHPLHIHQHQDMHHHLLLIIHHLLPLPIQVPYIFNIYYSLSNLINILILSTSSAVPTLWILLDTHSYIHTFNIFNIFNTFYIPIHSYTYLFKSRSTSKYILIQILSNSYHP